MGKMAQVDDINRQQTEEHDRLAPLRRVAPESPDIFQDEGANIPPNPCQSAAELVGHAWRVGKRLPGPAPRAEPLPMAPKAGAALNHGGRVIENSAKARKSQKT